MHIICELGSNYHHHDCVRLPPQKKKKHQPNHENHKQQATHPLIRTSQVSLSSNPDADFRYSTIFTPIGLYKGQLFAIKKVRKKSIDITREMKMELKLVRIIILYTILLYI